MELTYTLLRKLIEESEGAKVIPFPTKASNETEEFYLSAEQAKVLSNIVAKFGGDLGDLLEPVNKQRRVAEGEVISLPRSKGSEKPFLSMTPEEFEEGGFVVSVNRDITKGFEEMISALDTVPRAIADAKSWYYDLNDIIKSITENENEMVVLATMMAAFSHNTDFYRNLLEAVFAFKAYQMDDKDCLSKYVSTMEGHSAPKFGKLKLTNFALNILDPSIAESKDNYWNSTMDRWMFRAFYPGIDETVIKKMTGRNVAYIYLTKVLGREAEKLSMAVHELQAVIWVAIMYKTRNRIDTLPPLLLKIKEKFLTEMDGLEQVMEKEKEDLSEMKNIIPSLASRIRSYDMLRDYIKKASSEAKREVLRDVDDELEKRPPTDCDPARLATHYVLENYVGMRRDKKRNIKAILVIALQEGWTVASGVEYLRSMIGFEATRQKDIIP